MVLIQKSTDKKLVTRGAYENFYKSLGYELVEEGSTKVEHNENVVLPTIDENNDDKENDEVVNENTDENKENEDGNQEDEATVVVNDENENSENADENKENEDESKVNDERKSYKKR